MLLSSVPITDLGGIFDGVSQVVIDKQMFVGLGHLPEGHTCSLFGAICLEPNVARRGQMCEKYKLLGTPKSVEQAIEFARRIDEALNT